MGGCQSSPFPIDFAGRPYNSAMLPRVLWYRNVKTAATSHFKQESAAA